MTKSLLIGLVLSGVCFGEPPKSPQAVSAIKEADHAVEVAEQAFKQAKVAAEKKLILKLNAAMTVATRAGNLTEANSINDAIKDAQAKITEIEDSPSTSGVCRIVLAKDFIRADQSIQRQAPDLSNLTLKRGSSPSGWIEWAFNVPAGNHYVHFMYTSGSNRACRLVIGDKSASVMGESTGGWTGDTLKWTTSGPFKFPQGTTIVRLETGETSPHLKAIAVSDSPEDPEIPKVK